MSSYGSLETPDIDGSSYLQSPTVHTLRWRCISTVSGSGYVYVYIYIYTLLYIYIYVYKHIYMCSMYICIYVCVSTWEA